MPPKLMLLEANVFKTLVSQNCVFYKIKLKYRENCFSHFNIYILEKVNNKNIFGVSPIIIIT